MYIVGSKFLTWRMKFLFWISLSLILLPFLAGFVGMIFTSLGVTYTWSTAEFTFLHIKRAISDLPLLKSLFVAVVRGNLIALFSFFFVYLIGFLFVTDRSGLTKKYNIFFLTLPHVAFATGVLFLIAPSGFVFRLVAPLFMWEDPPAITTANDNYGITMAVVALIKVVPFIVFSFVGTLSDYSMTSYITQARLMGKNKFIIWTFVIFPQVIDRFTLPFFIALAYVISPVDISTIIGPFTPPSFGVEMTTRFLRADRLEFIDANIGSFFLMFTTFFSITLWYGLFFWLKKLLQWCYIRVQNIVNCSKVISKLGVFGFLFILCSSFFSALIVFVWSFTKLWSFPSLVPNSFTYDHITTYTPQLTSSAFYSLWIALVGSFMSLLFVLLILESVIHLKQKILVLVFIMLPLLIPQIVYVMGIHQLFLYLRINGSFFALVWAHMQYIVPYMFLILYGPYQTFDNRYMAQGRILGKTVFRSFLQIKLPMLLSSISFAFTIGMLVSIAQYLTTLLIGEGRYTTVTLYMISLSSGGSRRMMGTTSVLLILLNITVVTTGFLLSKLQKGTREVKL